MFNLTVKKVARQLKKMEVLYDIVKYPCNVHPYKPFTVCNCEMYSDEDFWHDVRTTESVVLLHSVKKINGNIYIRAFIG